MPLPPPPATPGGPPPGLALVRLLARLVPAHRRGDWVMEWTGELAWAAHDARRRDVPPPVAWLHLHRRALGAVADALWLRHHHGAPAMLGPDVRHAARALRARPGFTAAVVLTLALGIGATTAVFSVVSGVLLRPLPFPDPERLVLVENVAVAGDAEKVGPGVSYPDWVDYRAQTTTFAGLAAEREQPVTLTAPGVEPAQVRARLVTPDFLPTLGVRPVVGRGFLPGDAVPGAEPVVVLGHALWQQRYGADVRTLGARLIVDGVPTTIVGVLPPDLRLPGDGRVWLPLVPGAMEEVRGVHRLSVVGRLREGVPLARAEGELAAVARRLAAQYPADNTDRGVRVAPLRDTIVAPARPALLVLFGAVALTLVVACTNLASLFLARAATRTHEMAVRASLGAGGAQLVRQWMTESLLLTGAGALAGLLVAWAGMRALLAWAPGTIPRADEVALDLPVLGFLLGTSALAGLAFGLLPALHGRVRAGRRSAAAAALVLRQGGRGATAGTGARRLRAGLVVGEIALATVLVIGAGLLIKNAWQLQRAPLGFVPEQVALVPIQLPPTRYDSAGKVLRFYERLREEVASVPGVASVALAYEHPLSAGWTTSHTIAGRPQPAPGTEPEARARPVWPGYFRTVGLPLRRGRDVSERDRLGAPGVVVVNEAFVRRHFAGGEDPIGQRLLRSGVWWPGQPTEFEIVGVVADEPFLGVGRGADAATYYPHAQFPMNDLWLVVRARTDLGSAAALAPALRERIWRVDRDLPVERVRTMQEILGESVAEPRFGAALLALFAAAALALAAVGVYGVLSYTVAQRTREIGVRMALGAAQGRIVRQVVSQGVALAAAGVAAGVVAALGLGGVLEALLVGVSGRDPLVFAGVTVTLALVATAAAWLPARRASRIAPSAALRYEA